MIKQKLIPELRFPEFKNEGEWEETTLGDIGNFIGGGTPDTAETKYWNGNIQWYTPTEVKEGKVGKSIRTITEDGLRNSSAKLLPKGSLLLTTRATIGDIAIADFECTTNQGFQSLVVNETEANTFWFYWIIQHKNELLKKASGSTFPEIGKNEITKIKALKPNKYEQQRIASCLSSLDEVIAAHSQKLDALKNHKKGLMQNLFPQSRLNCDSFDSNDENDFNNQSNQENHKNHSSDNIPKYRFKEFEKDGEWVEKKLSEMSIIGRGKSKHRPRDAEHLYGGKYPFIQTGDIRKADLYLSNYTQTYSDKGLKQSKLWNENTLCITIAANIAETSILKIKACFPDSIIGLITNEKVANILFIKYSFDVFKERIQSLSQGVAQENLNQEKLSNIEFSFPSIQEQQKIASCLSSLDALITAQAEKIEQLKLHKKGLMQGLFPKMSE